MKFFEHLRSFKMVSKYGNGIFWYFLKIKAFFYSYTRQVSISPWSVIIIRKSTNFVHILHHDQLYKKLILKSSFRDLTWTTPRQYWSDFVPSCFLYQIETLDKVSVLILMGRISTLNWIVGWGLTPRQTRIFGSDYIPWCSSPTVEKLFRS